MPPNPRRSRSTRARAPRLRRVYVSQVWPRSPSQRARRATLGPDRPRARVAARLAAQTRSTFDTSAPRAGDTGTATSTARVWDLALRLHDRAERRDDRFLGSKDH